MYFNRMININARVLVAGRGGTSPSLSRQEYPQMHQSMKMAIYYQVAYGSKLKSLHLTLPNIINIITISFLL